jgi:hypothetical protein
VTCLALALLAGFGLDDVIARRARLPRALLAVAVVLPALVVLVHAPVHWSQFGDAAGIAAGLVDATGKANLSGLLPMSAALDWLVLAGVGVAIVLWRPGPRAHRRRLVLDLCRFGMGQKPVDPAGPRQAARHRSVRFLQARAPRASPGSSPTSDHAAARRCRDALRASGRSWLRLPGRGPLRRARTRGAVAPKLPFIPADDAGDATPLSLKVLGCRRSAARRAARRTSGCRAVATTAPTRG